MNARTVQFEWDEVKAEANARKHGVTFELASTVFHDPRLLTDAGPAAIKIRLISARKSTHAENRRYEEGL